MPVFNDGTLVTSDVSYTMGPGEIELVLISTLMGDVWVWNDINGTGNELANTIHGNPGANRIYGMAGNDTLLAAGGNDYVHGGDGDDNIYAGNGGGEYADGQVTLYDEDTIYGGLGNDTLDGGLGNDRMYGGAGDECYVVRDIGDLIVEQADQGWDFVLSHVDYTLSLHVEELELTGTAKRATGNSQYNLLVGNGLNNVLSGLGGNDELEGNEGNDTLDGGVGADTMWGGSGNDTYVVDSRTDVVKEGVGKGTDTVRSSVSWTLAANLERLVLLDSAANGTGNALDNKLTGNAADNVLNGGAGADTMAGGQGNDTYVVDDIADVVTEGSGAGTDKVKASISFTLGNNVEHLVLTGTAAIKGTGNALANILTGNATANVLYGLGGNDKLVGGAGNDKLVGGAGKDVFHFDTALNASTNVDTITDFVAADDTIQLENAILKRLTAPGALNTANFKANATGRATDSNDHIVYETDTGKLFYDADGSGSGAAVQIATLVGAPALTAADFVVG